MKKVTVVLLLFALFLVSCGEINDKSSTDSIDLSSVSSEESDISTESYLFEESKIDGSSSGEDSSSVEEDLCTIYYGIDTETAKVFEITGEKAVAVYDLINERMEDAPEPTEEQSKKHLGLKVEDNTAPTEQPLHVTFYSEKGMPYYSIYRDGFTTWSPAIYMSSIRCNMLPEDTFDEIVKMAGINLD